MRMPETCWAVFKRQVINLWNCYFWLVGSFESHLISEVLIAVTEHYAYGLLKYDVVCSDEVLSRYPRHIPISSSHSPLLWEWSTTFLRNFGTYLLQRALLPQRHDRTINNYDYSNYLNVVKSSKHISNYIRCALQNSEPLHFACTPPVCFMQFSG
jgi:hypothetical protein